MYELIQDLPYVKSNETMAINRFQRSRLTFDFSAKVAHTVSHFSYAPLFQGPHFLTKMLELNILYDNLLIDILSVL